MANELPLPTLLSQTLVAFTIEFDNEAEHQIPHRTTRGPAATSRNGPWLVSQAMWSNFMQFVEADGVPLRDLEGFARMTNLKGLQRWGYIVVRPDPAGSSGEPSRSASVVRPTRRGRMAQDIWRPLGAVVEDRWQTRFGREEIARLRRALLAIIAQLDMELPDYLPVLGYGMFATVPELKGLRARHTGEGGEAHLDLSALLSKVLLTFTLEFERQSEVSLAMSANGLRVLGGGGVRLRDMARLSGVSKEGITMMVGYLEGRGYVVVTRDPNDSRTKIVGLTTKGHEARRSYERLQQDIEQRWGARFGAHHVHTLRLALERLVGVPTAETSPLFQGLEPYPEGWRAAVRKPATLPHYPMVLHRGGYPDGS